MAKTKRVDVSKASPELQAILERIRDDRHAFHRRVSEIQLRGVVAQQGRTGGEALGTRTGDLRRSWAEAQVEIEGQGGAREVVSVVGSDHPAAAIQEFGGHISPVHASALWWPIGEGLTAKGVPRYPSVGSLIESVDPEDRAFVPLRGGATGIFARKDENDDLEPLAYWTRLGVDLPATHYASRGVLSVVDEVEDELHESGKRWLGEGAGAAS